MQHSCLSFEYLAWFFLTTLRKKIIFCLLTPLTLFRSSLSVLLQRYILLNRLPGPGDIVDSNIDHDDDYNGGYKARTRRSWFWLLRQDRAEGEMMFPRSILKADQQIFSKPGCEQFPRARVQVPSSSLWIAWPCPQVTSLDWCGWWR